MIIVLLQNYMTKYNEINQNYISIYHKIFVLI